MGWFSLRTVSAAFGGQFLNLALLATPALILGIASLQYHSWLLMGGAFAEFFLATLLLRSRQIIQSPGTALAILLYIIALGWFWFVTREINDAFAHFTRGTFVLIAMVLFFLKDLTSTGVEPRRLARKYTREIFTNVFWPENVMDYSKIEAVRKLRTVVEHDPTLCFILLDDQRAEVQIAGLMALQGRTYWRWEEASVVLRVARSASDEEVRALAIHALANAETAEVVRGMTEFLKDPSHVVRQATVESLLIQGEIRWGLIRQAIRDVLSNPIFAKERVLTGAPGRLPAIALCDLSAWVIEPAPLAERAIFTLLAHYDILIQEGTNPALPSELGRQLIDDTTPPALRIELAVLLRKHGMIPPELLDRMSDADQPGPIRLLAAEVMLQTDQNDSSALDVLRGIGRLSNRDTALVIARLLNTFQGIDFGVTLEKGSLTPKQMTEVTRQVLLWATGKSVGASSDPTLRPLLNDDSIPAGTPIQRGRLRPPTAESNPGSGRPTRR